jgi:hypothetical protein
MPRLFDEGRKYRRVEVTASLLARRLIASPQMHGDNRWPRILVMMETDIERDIVEAQSFNSGYSCMVAATRSRIRVRRIYIRNIDAIINRRSEFERRGCAWLSSCP